MASSSGETTARRGRFSSRPARVSGWAPSGRRRSSRSVTGCFSPRASSGSTRATGSTPSSSPFPPTGRKRRSLLAEELVASKVAAVVAGGATRAESVRAALAQVPDEALVVIVHDAARPLVDDAVIERVHSARSGRGTTASCRASRSPTRSSGSSEASSSRPSTARISSPCRRRRRSRRPRCVPPTPVTIRSPQRTAHRSSRRGEAGSASSTATSGC